MVQHFSEEYNTFIQHIENQSSNMTVFSITNVKYLNMLQMGDIPEKSGSV